MMGSDKERKQPPIWLILIVVFLLFGMSSIGVTRLFQLPWQVPIPSLWGRVGGIILLGFGFFFLIGAFTALKVHRAFGKEIYKTQAESQLVTTGVYAYTRNPLYFGSTVLFFGWFFLFQLTFLLILAVLFVILFYFVARWEETELTERFGEEYLQYKERVPFFLPSLKK